MLPLSFAQSFPPERMYLSKLLRLLKKQKFKLPNDNISKITGIPNGGSSGKVSPSLKYLMGMWLVIQSDDDWYELSDFGRAVLSVDKSLSEPITQWTCHALLCDEKFGAIINNSVFRRLIPGKNYSREDIEVIVKSDLRLEIDNRCFSAFFSMYSNEDSFKAGKIFIKSNDSFCFNSAPENHVYIPMFGAVVCHFYNEYFHTKGQISLDEFLRVTGFNYWFGKRELDCLQIFEQIAGAGYIKINKLLSPPVFSQLKKESDCWAELYDNLI